MSPFESRAGGGGGGGLVAQLREVRQRFGRLSLHRCATPHARVDGRPFAAVAAQVRGPGSLGPGSLGPARCASQDCLMTSRRDLAVLRPVRHRAGIACACEYPPAPSPAVRGCRRPAARAGSSRRRASSQARLDGCGTESRLGPVGRPRRLRRLRPQLLTGEVDIFVFAGRGAGAVGGRRCSGTGVWSRPASSRIRVPVD